MRGNYMTPTAQLPSQPDTANRPVASFMLQPASTAGHVMSISKAQVTAAAWEQVISSMGACQMLYAC